MKKRARNAALPWAFIGIFALLFPATVTRAQAPPAGYNTLKTNFILGSTDPGGWAGSGTGTMETNNGVLPFDTSVTNPATGLPSFRVNNMSALPSGGWWSSHSTPHGWATVTLTSYRPNGHLEFDVKGNAGGEVFNVGFEDYANERTINSVLTTGYDVTVPSSSYVTVTTGWQHVSIPISAIIPNGSPFVVGQMMHLLITNANLNAMKFWISGAKVTSPDKEASYPAIKVNEVGYTTSAAKYAIISDWYENLSSINNGTAFQVKKSSDNSVVYSGTLTWLTDYDNLNSGDKALKADFSSFSTAGTYYVSVAGLTNSVPFAIGNTIYDQMIKDVTRYYYFQRANLALVAPYDAGWDHPAWHTDDANCPLQNTSIFHDVHAGWYDAGDFGKYCDSASAAVSDLMWMYETYPAKFPDSTNNIPESGNGKSDMLDEIKYETDFLLRMQDTATGGFWSYVYPNNDKTSARYISNIEPTSETGAAVGALAHASIVFASYDPTYAATCLTAAKAGFTYLLNHPTLVADAGNNADNDDPNDRFWAAAELCRATGNQATYENYFIANYANFWTRLDDPNGMAHVAGRMEIPAFFAYMKSATPNSTFVSTFNTKFDAWRTKMMNRQTACVWGNTQNNNYYWGTNEDVLAVPEDMVIGTKIRGTYDSTVIAFVRQELNFILGVNPLSMSYVTGYGANADPAVFSHIYNEDGKAGIPPGYMAGGSNQYDGAWFSNFGAKCFTTSNEEWTTNEHDIFWNAALSFNVTVMSAEAGGVTIPPTPTGLAATPGNAQVALTWSASSGATSYNVKRSTINGSGYATVSSPTVTNYTNTGLTNGTTYYFVVSAVNSAGESANSSQVSAAPVAPPAAPTGLTATPGNTQVALSWTASSGATSYNVLRSTVNGSGYASVVTGITVTSYTNTGLTNGTTYYFVVTATNAGGTSGNSNQASATPQVSAPPAPTGLTATPGNAQVALSWTASSGATSYNALRSTVNGSGYASVATGIATTSYTNTGLTNGTAYYFVVTATNAGGTSGNSNQASATPSGGSAPPAPTGLTTSAGSTQALVFWTASTGATSYNVLRSTVSGSGYASIASGLAVTFYDNTGLTNGTVYYYVAQAVNASGTSGNSAQASASPAAAPQAQVAYATTAPVIDGTVDSIWSSATAYSANNIVNYGTGTVKSNADLSVTWQTLWDTTNLYVLATVTDDVLMKYVTNPWDGDAVEVYIDATNSKTTTYGATDFQYEFPWNSTTIVETKHSPGSLTGVAFAQTNISGGYRVEIKIPWTTLGVTPAGNNLAGIDIGVNDADTTAGTRDSKRLWNDTTDNDWSNPSLFGTGKLIPASGPPPAPTGLTATPGNAQVVLSWSASTGATSYNVKRSTVNGSGYATVSSPTTTSYTNTGLANGTTYYYVVTAVNAGGESGNSNQASATPVSGDTSRYNFESGTQSWTFSGAPITGVAQSSAQHFAGADSLAVTINGAPANQNAYVLNPAVTAGQVVTYHVWIPSGIQISAIQPYVEDHNWAWTGNIVPIASLTTNAWNTVTVTVPSGAAQPMNELGVEFRVSATWSGTCYIDAVNW